MLANLKIGKRLILITIAVLAGMAGVSTVDLFNLQAKMQQDVQVTSKSMVEAAVHIIESYDRRAKTGEFTEEEAERRTIKMLDNMSYGQGGYVFAMNMEGVFVAHPKWEGQNHLDEKDARGHSFVRDFIELAKQGGGFYQYHWLRDPQKPAVPKITYVMPYGPWGWLVGSGVYADEINAEFFQEAKLAGGIALILIIVIGGLVSIIGRGITRPLSEITAGMNDLAGGDKTISVNYTKNRDEIGELARALESFKANAIRMEQLENEQREQKRRAEEERVALMNRLAADFESNVQGIITSVAAAATELYQTAENMQKTVTSLSDQSGTAAMASAETTSNVQSVSAAVEEMSSSVKEIASQIAKSATLVTETVTQTQQADKTTQMLSEAVAQISGILELIQNIAGQINLLALNATIESARAGDAGKGFAVVASEVKNLAGQTTKATEQIAKQITSVQQASKEVVGVLKTIQDAIGNVNQYSSGIGSAVEEQSAATNEISINMQHAAQRVQDITSNITGITKSASDADHAAKEVLSAAQMLSKQSELLSQQVNKFIQEIRA